MSRSGHRFLPLGLALVFASALHAQNPPAPPPAAGPQLADPEIAHVAVTANGIDIEAAKFAQTRTRNAGVKQFAATMITDHTAVNEQAAALAKKLGVTPADNPVSQSLQSGAKEAHAKLDQFLGCTEAEMAAWLRRMLGWGLADAVRTLGRARRDDGGSRRSLPAPVAGRRCHSRMPSPVPRLPVALPVRSTPVDDCPCLVSPKS